MADSDRVLSWKEIAALAMNELHGSHDYREGVKAFEHKIQAQKETHRVQADASSGQSEYGLSAP